MDETVIKKTGKIFGLDFVIAQNILLREHKLEMKFGTGYVKVPEHSILNGKKHYYTDSKLRPIEKAINDISIYGGLTFAGRLKNRGGWWFGFDTAHDIKIKKWEWSDKKILRELEKLALQIKRITNEYSIFKIEK